jgi:hypothetical protein
MMSAIISSAAQSAAANGSVAKPASPVAWCAERGMPGEPLDALLWRGVLADGADAMVDRMTAMTNEPPVTLTAARNSMVDIVQRESGGPAGEWEATTSQDSKTSIWGYFTGRPKPEALAALYADILAGKAQPLSTYAVNGKQISIGAPAKK